MTNLQLDEDCQVNDSINAFSPDAESSLHLPLDGSMCIVFTGHYNGISVEIRSPNEMTLLSHMGCFGKGSASRSQPKTVQNNSPSIMRKRQFLKRNYWYKRFGKHERVKESETFFKDIDNLITKLVHDTKNQVGRDVIDLVSTDDENSESENCNTQMEFDEVGKNNIVVLVPNSDSEGDNYFANMKPKCCINKISLQEKLILTLEEAFFLLYGLGCLQIVFNDHQIFDIEECWKAFSESNPQFIERYVVYHYFRSKGYIVKPGIKFGGDYLLYKDGPSVNHADYIVIINFGQNNFNWISILGHVRMATTTVKEIMIAEVIKPSKTNIDLPQDLCEYKVRELVLTRKLPVKINDSED